MRPAFKLMVIFVGAGLLQAFGILFARHSMPWAALIPAVIPSSTVVLVIIPARQAKPRGGR